MVSGIDGLLTQHQRVERVAVVAEGARDEAVVGGIVHGAVEYAVEPQQAGLLVQLVLVLAAHRNFDDDGEHLLDHMVVNVDVVPSVHAFSLSRKRNGGSRHSSRHPGASDPRRYRWPIHDRSRPARRSRHWRQLVDRRQTSHLLRQGDPRRSVNARSSQWNSGARVVQVFARADSPPDGSTGDDKWLPSGARAAALA